MRNFERPTFRPLRSWMRGAVVPAVLTLSAALLLLPSESARAGEDLAPGVGTARIAEARIELGRRLFFEPMASPSGRRSCASCHDPDHGFSDPKRLSADDFGLTRRHSQAILDTAHNPSAHWDGEFENVEALVKARLTATPQTGAYGRGRSMFNGLPLRSAGRTSAKEHMEALRKAVTALQEIAGPLGKAAGSSRKDLAEKRLKSGTLRIDFGQVLHIAHAFGRSEGGSLEGGLRVPERITADGRYAHAIERAFGKKKITLDEIATCLSAYCKTIRSTESPFDRFRAGVEEALSASAKRGLALFEGRAGCAQCHVMRGRHPRFTNYGFHNTGVAWNEVMEGNLDGLGGFARLLQNDEIKERLKEAAGDETVAEQLVSVAMFFADRGHQAVAKKGGGPRSFKTATLRDVAKRGPYMHNGRFETLAAVVSHYAGGCGDDPEKDRRLKGFEAGPREVADLVAFLTSLSGDERPGLAKSAWRARAKSTRLRFVDFEGKPMKGMKVGVHGSGDVLPGGTAEEGTEESPLELVSDEEGWVRYAAPATTHTKLRLPDGLLPVGGDLVPDTCRQVTIQLPVKGRMKLVVTFSTGQTPPAVVFVAPPPPMKSTPAQIKDLRRAARTVRLPVNLHARARPREPTRFVRTTVAHDGGLSVAIYAGWVRSDFGSDQAQMTLAHPAQAEATNGRVCGPFKHAPGAVAQITLVE